MQIEYGFGYNLRRSLYTPHSIYQGGTTVGGQYYGYLAGPGSGEASGWEDKPGPRAC